MWRDLYQSDWPVAPDPMRDVVFEYHRRCDAFDDVVCTGKYRGLAVPANHTERRLMLRNAMEVREDLLRRHNITNTQFQTALRRYPDLD